MSLQRLERGRGDRIVFLHGVGSDATVWGPQLEDFDGHCRIAFDMPGYRGSPPAPAQDAASLARLVLASTAADAGRLHLVGLSLGAVVAAHAAALHGDRIASLTLASGFVAYPDGATVAERARRMAETDGMAALAAARIGRILHPSTAATTRSSVAATMAAIPVDAYQRMSTAVWTADLTSVAPAIRVPTLVIAGEDDPVTPPTLGAPLAAAIPGARLECVARASHLVNLDRPDAFNALVRRHVEANP